MSKSCDVTVSFLVLTNDGAKAARDVMERLLKAGFEPIEIERIETRGCHIFTPAIQNFAADMQRMRLLAKDKRLDDVTEDHNT
jgi:hypothetical protein